LALDIWTPGHMGKLKDSSMTCSVTNVISFCLLHLDLMTSLLWSFWTLSYTHVPMYYLHHLMRRSEYLGVAYGGQQLWVSAGRSNVLAKSSPTCYTPHPHRETSELIQLT
jgi:hypothetical protein